MELVPGSPGPNFKERPKATYDAHAEERDRSGDSKWRRPLLEKAIALVKQEGKGRITSPDHADAERLHIQFVRARK